MSEQPIVLPGCEKYEPQQRPAWQANPKHAIATIISW